MIFAAVCFRRLSVCALILLPFHLLFKNNGCDDDDSCGIKDCDDDWI